MTISLKKSSWLLGTISCVFNRWSRYICSFCNQSQPWLFQSSEEWEWIHPLLCIIIIYCAHQSKTSEWNCEMEPHSLYVDGKAKNVNLSVFQEQNKQIKNSPSKWRILLFWYCVLTSSWTDTFFMRLFKSLHTHP